jgi:outer membrane receptor protein involved in Fe transport
VTGRLLGLLFLLFTFPIPAWGQEPPTDERPPLYWEEGEHSVLDDPLLSHLRYQQRMDRIARMASVASQNELADSVAPTMLEGLVDHPGLYLRRVGGAQIQPNLRGLSGRNIRYLADGIPLGGAVIADASPFLPTVDPFSLRGVEVLHGPGSVQYGSGSLGGTIHLLTQRTSLQRDGFDYNGRLVGRFGVADRERAGSAGTEFYFGQPIGASLQISAQELDRLDGGGDIGPQEGTSSHREFYQASTDWLPVERIRLTLTGQHGEIEHAPVPNAHPEEQIKSRRRDLASIRMTTRNISPVLPHTEILFAYQEIAERRHFLTAGISPAKNTEDFVVRTLFLSTTIHSMPYSWFGIDLGAEGGHQFVSSNASLLNRTDGPSPLPDDAVADTVGALAQFRVEPAPWLQILPGYRLDLFSARAELEKRRVPDETLTAQFSEHAYELRLLFPVARHTRLILGGSRGFRFPSLQELAGAGPGMTETADPNPDLLPESNLSYEFGYRLVYPFVKISLFGYQSFLQDRIMTEPVESAPRFRPENQDAAMIAGAEGSAELYLGINWALTATFSYAYGQDDQGEPLADIPPYFGGAKLRWTDDNNIMFVEGSTQWGAGKGRYSLTEIDAGEKVSAYATVDAALGFNVTNYIDVRLIGRNLTDLEYRTLGSTIYEPGTNFRAQLDMHF